MKRNPGVLLRGFFLQAALIAALVIHPEHRKFMVTVSLRFVRNAL
jgi:hypothetical protein